MGWREWFGLKLSPDQFALMVIKRAKKIEDVEYQYSPKTNELFKGKGAGTGTIFLGRVYDQYCQSPAKDRIAVVDKFLSSMASTPENTIPKVYADAKARLLPIVRDQIDLSIGNLMSSRFAAGDHAQGKQAPSMTAIPFVDKLIVGLAFDSPNAIHRLTDQRFEDWGIAASAALEDAIDNLREQTKAGGWERLDGNVWSGNWGDAYASSRMLTPEVIHQVGLADPLVMVPSPEFIVMIGCIRCAWRHCRPSKSKEQASAFYVRLSPQRKAMGSCRNS